MTDYIRLAGSTDVSVVLFIFNPTTGVADTGVVFNTSGLDLQYRREGAASVAITEVTLAALTTAHTDGGFLHIGNGYYRLDLPDAAVAASVAGVQVHGALTSRSIVGCYIHLVAYNPLDAVRLGLTSLPNVASGSAGAIPTTGTGANQLSVTSGLVTLGDGTLTAAKFAASAITSTVIATGAIDADALATDAVTEIQSGLSTLGMSTALPGSPTADTVGAALKRASVGIPLSAAGASGGLAMYDDLFSVVAEGTLASVASASNMTLNANFVATADFYVGMFLVPQSGNAAKQPRAISTYSSGRVCTFTGTGSQISRPFTVAPAPGDPVKILGLSGTI